MKCVKKKIRLVEQGVSRLIYVSNNSYTDTPTKYYKTEAKLKTYVIRITGETSTCGFDFLTSQNPRLMQSHTYHSTEELLGHEESADIIYAQLDTRLALVALHTEKSANEDSTVRRGSWLCRLVM